MILCCPQAILGGLADYARADGIVSYGSSRIVDSHGHVRQSAQELAQGLVVADLDVSRTASMAMR